MKFRWKQNCINQLEIRFMESSNSHNLSVVVGQFFPQEAITEIISFGNGHINDTYRVSFLYDPKYYILQRINTNVFKNPVGIVENHIKLQQQLADKNETRVIPELYPTQNGSFLFVDGAQNVWRMISFIEESYSIDLVEHEWQALEAGKAYGWFAQVCATLNASDFVEAIKDFHRLSFRLRQLNEAIAANKAGRLASIQDIVDFYKSRESKLRVIESLVDAGEIPMHVVHNDTKINNLLFKDDKAIAVIDLDTVGPGILFYDYGDAIRTSTNLANEDEQDLSKVGFNLKAFEAFTNGYLSQVKTIVTEKEKHHFYLAPVLLTYIMGIRFLADFLNGDVYYKIAFPEHNLVRSKVQMRFIECMEIQQDKMIQVIQKELM